MDIVKELFALLINNLLKNIDEIEGNLSRVLNGLSKIRQFLKSHTAKSMIQKPDASYLGLILGYSMSIPKTFDLNSPNFLFSSLIHSFW